MNVKTGIGRPGLSLAVAVAIAMCILSFIYKPVTLYPYQFGLCLASPEYWEFNPFGSWIVNTCLIGCISLLIYLINRTYNFIRTTEPSYLALTLILTASSPWFTQALNTSVILCLANMISLGVIFDTYDTKNATRELFILGIVAGTGAMIQYAFLPMAAIYLLWALLMKVLRIKETLAFFVGLLCPWWIALGVGWISFHEIHFPSINPIIGSAHDYSEFFMLLAGISLAACGGGLVALINLMKLYAGNSRVNAMNLCVSLLGAACVVCIIADYDNMGAYVVSLYLACAVQIGNICALWNPKMPWMVTVLPSLPFIAIFICSLLF